MPQLKRARAGRTCKRARACLLPGPRLTCGLGTVAMAAGAAVGVARDLQEYQKLAVALAADPARLSSLRQRLWLSNDGAEAARGDGRCVMAVRE